MTEAAAATNVRPFDFRSPCRLSLHVESQVSDWQRRAARLLPQKWLAWLPLATSWTCPTPETIDCAAAEFPEHFVVFQVDVEGQQQPTLLAFPSELAVALVLTILGENVESKGEPRAVTSIETSILDLLVTQSIEALNEGGSGAGYPLCTAGGHVERPIPIRLFPVEESLVVLRFSAQFPWGEGAFQWIWPESMAEGLFVDAQPLADVSEEESRVLSAVSLRLPFDIRVELGSVSLLVSELANLSEGDVLVLDQKISEPLQCHVGDQLLLRAWPTVTGNRQSIQVAAVEPQ